MDLPWLELAAMVKFWIWRKRCLTLAVVRLEREDSWISGRSNSSRALDAKWDSILRRQSRVREWKVPSCCLWNTNRWIHQISPVIHEGKEPSTLYMWPFFDPLTGTRGKIDPVYEWTRKRFVHHLYAFRFVQLRHPLYLFDFVQKKGAQKSRIAQHSLVRPVTAIHLVWQKCLMFSLSFLDKWNSFISMSGNIQRKKDKYHWSNSLYSLHNSWNYRNHKHKKNIYIYIYHYMNSKIIYLLLKIKSSLTMINGLLGVIIITTFIQKV